ncbi:MAG: superoxide dismutase family protein [Gammaproteobacteria bacterium]|nr:superoxide dismutase family protein [Gammaproteobacteria bacterium]MCH9763626.1 superoxide dismutase family protein [Gammaproteobacteria bacterium]
MHKYILGSILFFACVFNVYAASMTTELYATDSKHESKGTISFKDSPGGLLITPKLHGLPPGPHGFHIHKNPSCDNQGTAAGGHLDPQKKHAHQGPYGKGHLGDLPVIYINAEGQANASVIAPRLSIADIEERSVILHAGGDTYSNIPPMGGGQARIACGVTR